jgi:DNA-binding MarR family transcriptional regulator
VARTPLSFDPIDEARLQWAERWQPDVSDAMAAATSIMRAQQVVLAAVDGTLRPFGLTFARYEGLVLLLHSRRGVLPLGKMGQRLMIHPTSVTNIIDRLEHQGLVRRVPHPTDGRTTLAELTEEGRRLARRATAAVNEVAFGLGGLSTQDLQELMRIIRKLRIGVGDFTDD